MLAKLQKKCYLYIGSQQNKNQIVQTIVKFAYRAKSHGFIIKKDGSYIVFFINFAAEDVMASLDIVTVEVVS